MNDLFGFKVLSDALAIFAVLTKPLGLGSASPPPPERKVYLEAQLDSLSRQQSPGFVKMPMLQIDSTCTQGGKERWFKTAACCLCNVSSHLLNVPSEQTPASGTNRCYASALLRGITSFSSCTRKLALENEIPVLFLQIGNLAHKLTFYNSAEYYYEFLSLHSLDKGIMADPTINIPLLGTVPHKASGRAVLVHAGVSRLLAQRCFVHFMQPPQPTSQAQETFSPCPLLVLRPSNIDGEHPNRLKISPSSAAEISVSSECNTISALVCHAGTVAVGCTTVGFPCLGKQDGVAAFEVNVIIMNSEGNIILQTPQNAIFFKTCQQDFIIVTSVVTDVVINAMQVAVMSTSGCRNRNWSCTLRRNVREDAEMEEFATKDMSVNVLMDFMGLIVRKIRSL
ncbi:hypothetical protein EK904_001542 [Melospiza melodia maxima]|nr:hypothetical protein EK904_001542 [Melospiza melodia maxima]